MQEQEIVQKVIAALSLTGLEIWKPARGASPEITSIQIISGLLLHASISDASKYLKIGVQTLNRIVAKYIAPGLGNATGGNNTWRLKLLTAAKIKKCRGCSMYLEHSSFSRYVNTFDGLDTFCLKCKANNNAAFYADNKDTYHKAYIKEHRQEYVARNAQRKARKLQATPGWADLEKIRKIYNSCSEGYHVDHIIPLVSNLVCGLHVENNLQIIPAEENLRKGNKFSGDW